MLLLIFLINKSGYSLSRLFAADGEAGPVVEVDNSVRSVAAHYTVASVDKNSCKTGELCGVSMQPRHVESCMQRLSVNLLVAEFREIPVGRVAGKEEFGSRHAIELHEVSCYMCRYYEVAYSSFPEFTDYQGLFVVVGSKPHVAFLLCRFVAALYPPSRVALQWGSRDIVASHQRVDVASRAAGNSRGTVYYCGVAPGIRKNLQSLLSPRHRENKVGIFNKASVCRQFLFWDKGVAANKSRCSLHYCAVSVNRVWREALSAVDGNYFLSNHYFPLRKASALLISSLWSMSRILENL